MTRTCRYTVVLTPKPDGSDGSAYNVVVPALPGCFTWGETVEHALAMAHDAIATYLDGEPAADFSAPAGSIVAEIAVEVDAADGVLRPTAAAVPVALR